MTELERQLKHIKGLSKVLNVLASEVSKKEFFTQEDLDLLGKVGSDLLMKRASIPYTNQELIK